MIKARKQIKRQIFEMLELSSHRKLPAKVFDILMSALIMLNVLAFTFETVDSISIPNKSYFNDFEIVSVAIFTIEYCLRLWTCTLDRRFRHPILGRLRFAFTPLAIVDSISIFPYYILLLFPNWVFIREIYLFRLARLLKIGRYSESMRTLGNVLKAKRNDLFSALVVVFILLMIASSIIYFVEHAAQPKLFPNIPASMWWSVVTLTSVGYGDVYPITPMGKLFGGIIALMGLGLVALPTGILASGFAEEVEKKRRKQAKICPHCGNDIDEQSGTLFPKD